MEKDNLTNIRHSCTHLLAAAVMELWPNTKRTIGPAIEDGFYYDFDFGNVKVSEEDFPKIEAKMKDLLKDWEGFEGRKVSEKEAREFYKDNPYKLELIDEIVEKGEEITIYKSGNYEDLCRGGHSENPKKDIGAFKLLSVAGAYWRGSEKNTMLTRIYGSCFPTQKQLDEYLARLEEAKKRDHRRIGKDLGLFTFSEVVGKGLPLLTPYGSVIRRTLQRFVEDEEIKRGYEHVITPPLANVELYKISGHYPYYKDTMYPVMKVDEDELILRPMTCPHHFMLYKSAPRSYKELPVRFAETSPQFRYEKSGELTGLMRVRMFTLSDAHIFATVEQAPKVVEDVLNLIEYFNQCLGLKKGEDYRFRLSLGDRSDEKKYFKDDSSWNKAEEILRGVLNKTNAPYFEAKNEAAFYGPKIDIQIKNIAGKEETAFTVQYDFVMPKRFELKFVNPQGKDEQPVVIHRASLGAYERTMAFLIEKYGGAFPLWLSPVQVKIIPISDKVNEYAQKVLEQLKGANIRVEIDTKAETMQAKIREAQLQKIPFMLIIGKREESESTVSVRTREGKDLGGQRIEEFLTDLKQKIESKANL